MAPVQSTLAANDKTERLFKKAKKMAVYDVVQRRGDLDCFCVGALHFDDDTVRILMNCEDFLNPKTPEEAIAISKACMYGGLVIPQKVYEMAGEVDFIPKWVFSSMPFTENKKHCVAHAKARDGRFKKAYDHENNKSLGGISDSYDVTLNRSEVTKSSPSFSSRIEISDTVPDFHEENKIIKEQQDMLDSYQEFLEIAMNEVHNLRLVSKILIAKVNDDGTKWLPGLVTPETSIGYEEVLLKCWKGNMDGLMFDSDSDPDGESDDEEGSDDDAEDENSNAEGIEGKNNTTPV